MISLVKIQQSNHVGDINRFRNIFREDLVHLTDSSYILFAEYIKEKLKNK